MLQRQQSSGQQEVFFVGKLLMNFPSKSQSTIKQNVSKRIVLSKSGSSLNQNKTVTKVDPINVGGNNSRLNTRTDDSTRTGVELLNPPIYGSIDPRIASRASHAERSSSRRRSDFSIVSSNDSGPQPSLSAEVADSPSSNALESSK